MPQFRFLIAISLIIAAAGMGCTNNRKIDDIHRIAELYFPLDLAKTVTTKLAACKVGDVLLGSGYRVDHASLKLSDAVAVRANRPNGNNDWLITVVRNAATPPGAVSASLYIYCLHRADGTPVTLSSHMITSDESTMVESASGVAMGSASARCPSGLTLTSGGFSVNLGQSDTTNTAAVFNSWIWSSLPAQNRRSWNVEGTFIENGGPLPRIRAYAQCVSDPNLVLRASTASDVKAVRRNGFNFDFYEGNARCGEQAFAASGGFQFAGDKLIPRSIAKNQISEAFAGWSLRGVYGLERDGSAVLAVRPLCFEGLTIEKPDQVDLVALIGDNPLKHASCPAGAPICFTFTVLNAGTAASTASTAEFAGRGGIARINIPPLPPGEAVELTVAVSDPCATDCSATVTVDPDHEIAESKETNNTAKWFVVG